MAGVAGHVPRRQNLDDVAAAGAGEGAPVVGGLGGAERRGVDGEARGVVVGARHHAIHPGHRFRERCAGLGCVLVDGFHLGIWVDGEDVVAHRARLGTAEVALRADVPRHVVGLQAVVVPEHEAPDAGAGEQVGDGGAAAAQADAQDALGGERIGFQHRGVAGEQGHGLAASTWRAWRWAGRGAPPRSRTGRRGGGAGRAAVPR